MTTSLNGILAALPYLGLAILSTAALGVGCSSDQPEAAESRVALHVGGLRPSWDVEEMVKQSDAVVIGVVAEGLGAKLVPGGNNDPPRYHYEFRDFAFTVEEVLYAGRGELPDRIAIMTAAGITTTSSDITVFGGNDIPDFQAGERVLVFLDSLDDPVYAAEGVGRPVPKGITESSYFQVVIGARYSKLSLDDGQWKDSVSNEPLRRDELVAAIEQVVASGRESSPISDEATPPGSPKIRPLKAQYTMEQLGGYYRALGNAGVLGFPQITMTDLDEGRNLIEVGVNCESSRERVRMELQKLLVPLGVPMDAITIEVRARPYPLTVPLQFECIPAETIDPATGLSTPGFGGLYVDSGIATIYLLEPSQEEAEKLLLDQLGRRRFEQLQEVRALMGQYTWTQLTEWYGSIEQDMLTMPAVDLLTVDSRKNRLTIEVRTLVNDAAEKEIEAVLSDREVPREAVVLKFHTATESQ